MKFSDGQSEFSRVFNFAILCYSRNSRKLDARLKLVFCSTGAIQTGRQLFVLYFFVFNAHCGCLVGAFILACVGKFSRTTTVGYAIYRCLHELRDNDNTQKCLIYYSIL